VLIISTPLDLPLFKRLLGTGEQFGLTLTYAEQPSPDGLAQAFLIASQVGFLDDATPSALVLGDNHFLRPGPVARCCRPRSTPRARGDGLRLLGARSGALRRGSSSDPTAVCFQSRRSRRSRSPTTRCTGLYFYDSRACDFAAALQPSARGELEITDLNRCYLQDGSLQVERMGRGYAWLDTGTHDSLIQAGNFIQTIEERQGLKIACPEEIAFEQGWIDRAGLEAQIKRLGKSSYGEYLRRILA
jgi:glucose-1-phosphate thymidylyltransferase